MQLFLVIRKARNSTRKGDWFKIRSFSIHFRPLRFRRQQYMNYHSSIYNLPASSFRHHYPFVISSLALTSIHECALCLISADYCREAARHRTGRTSDEDKRMRDVNLLENRGERKRVRENGKKMDSTKKRRSTGNAGTVWRQPPVHKLASMLK